MQPGTENKQTSRSLSAYGQKLLSTPILNFQDVIKLCQGRTVASARMALFNLAPLAVSNNH